MRIFFILFLLLVSVNIFAQVHPENKSIQDIASMERQAHQRLANAATATLASNNFDVKYYRGEWEVDPAIRYIKGKVTVYYVITTTANSITLDLMSALTTDSVKQRRAGLSHLQRTMVKCRFRKCMDQNESDHLPFFCPVF